MPLCPNNIHSLKWKTFRLCFAVLLYPLELISVQYKKTTRILHCKIHKSTPDDNVKNYERCHEFFEWRNNFNISHFESYYDVFFRSCEILQIKPVDVSMKKSGICFLYFIDLSVLHWQVCLFWFQIIKNWRGQ